MSGIQEPGGTHLLENWPTFFQRVKSSAQEEGQLTPKEVSQLADYIRQFNGVLTWGGAALPQKADATH